MHWLIAILLLGQFIFGWWLGDIPRNTPARGYFVNLHKNTGILIGLLILWHLYRRLRHSPPPWGEVLQRRHAAAPWGPDDQLLYTVFNQTHKTTAMLLLALVLLHVSAAVWHGLRRDGIFFHIWLHPF